MNRLLPLLLQEAEFYTISSFGGFIGSVNFETSMPLCLPNAIPVVLLIESSTAMPFLFMSLVAVDLLIHPRLLVCCLAFFSGGGLAPPSLLEPPLFASAFFSSLQAQYYF